MADKQKMIVPNVRWMYNCFVHYNKEYFDGSLPIPEFSVECKDGYWGAYTPQFYYNDATYKVTKIMGNGILRLNGKLKRSVDSWVATLLHEMAHEYVFLIMKIYDPDDPHGKEFKRVASFINRKSGGKWNIEKYTEKISTDHIARKTDVYDGDGTEDNMYENATRNIVCVITKPRGRNYRVWVTKTDKGNIKKTAAMASKIKNATFKFYYCYSVGLFKETVDTQNLTGFGGMTMEEVVKNMSEYYGEPLQMFQNMVEITDLNKVNESRKRMHLAE